MTAATASRRATDRPRIGPRPIALAVGVFWCCGQAHAQQSPYAPASGGAANVVALKQGSAAPASATIGGTPAIPAYAPLTWNGITLYGALDVGVGYMSHGSPLSASYGAARNSVIVKNSGDSRWGIDPNAFGYSIVGLKGKEKLFSDVSFVFDGQTSFVPTSGRLSNGLASLVSNNGRTLASQSAQGDSSRAGQIFNSYSFIGLSSVRFGTLTFGRQNSFGQDGVVAYDPLFASNAFSVIGIQGQTAGTGDTENARLDNAFKYMVNIGPIRTGVLYQLDDAPGKGGKDGHGGGGAVQVDIGTTIKALSLDAIFSHVDDAINAATETAAQVRVAPANSLAATVSDDTSIMLLAKYRIGRLLMMAGYENIRFANPGNPVVAGTYDYRYQLAYVNNTAYTRNRLLQVVWGGGRYTVSKKFSVYAGYYHYSQNSYAANRCTDSSQGSCSGILDGVSLVGDYRLFKHFEIYGGAMLTSVANGLASGFQHRSNVDPTIGGRFTF